MTPTRKKLALGAGVVVALLVIIGAATGSDEPAPTATPTPTATTQASRSTQTAKPTRDPACQDVPPEKVQAILDGSTQGDLTPVKSAAVRSETGDTFVAIRVRHANGEDVGVWQATDAGRIGSVNAIAGHLTAWPDTGNAGAKAEREAEACIR